MADEQDVLDDRFYQELRDEITQCKKLPNQQPAWTNHGMTGIINFDHIQGDVTNLRICLSDGTVVGFINAGKVRTLSKGK